MESVSQIRLFFRICFSIIEITFPLNRKKAKIIVIIEAIAASNLR